MLGIGGLWSAFPFLPSLAKPLPTVEPELDLELSAPEETIEYRYVRVRYIGGGTEQPMTYSVQGSNDPVNDKWVDITEPSVHHWIGFTIKNNNIS